MELTNEIFSKNNTIEQIIYKVKKGHWSDIFDGLCSIKENNITLNYIYFRYIAQNDTYNCIIQHITNNIDKVLEINNEFVIHMNMKNLTISDIDKHKSFIQQISTLLKDKYPNKLTKCYVYNAPFMFSHVFALVSMFIDKETQKKIELVKK